MGRRTVLALVLIGLSGGHELFAGELSEESVTVMDSAGIPLVTFTGEDLELAPPAGPGQVTQYLGVERMALHEARTSMAASEVRDGVEHFAYTTSDLDVIISQPEDWQEPVVTNRRDSTIIEMAPLDPDAPRHVEGLGLPGNHYEEMMAARCRACSIRPNSCGDLDIWECVPGSCMWCQKCVSWPC